MKKLLLSLIILPVVGCSSQNLEPSRAGNKILTREQLFAPVTDPETSLEIWYVEYDLNGDGINELILSQPGSSRGTGGLGYNLYLGIGRDRFRKLDDVIANCFAVEVFGETKYLWSYTHSSCCTGFIECRCIDSKGELSKSSLAIRPGDGGTEIGNGILDSIFNDKTILEIKKR